MHVALTEGQVDVTLCGWCVCTCPINLSVLKLYFNIKLYLLKYRPFLAIRRRQWHPTPIFLPRKSHGRRSLVGCSPWGRWGSDMTEWLHFHFSLSHIGEGNGNSFQCSCLENPRRMPSTGSHRVRHNWSDLAVAAESPSRFWSKGAADYYLCF